MAPARPQQVEDHVNLRTELAPVPKFEQFGQVGQASFEVAFEGLDGSFGRVGTMHVGRSVLETYLLLGYEGINLVRGFIV